MRPLVRPFAIMAAIGSLLCAGSAPALAQPYPHKVITLVVTSAPGGPGDTAARLIVDRMSALLGQQIIVENTPGAGGTTGTARVARAEPDGYMLLLQQTGFAVTPALYPKLAFDVEKDFAAVGMINASYSFLAGRKSMPPNTFTELVAWMKGPGRPVKFAHPGVGTLGHLTTVMFAQSVGTEVDLIPYRGGGPAMNDIVAGHVDLVWAASSTSAELIRAGTIKGFGIQSAKRYATLPDIPTVPEMGYPDMDIKFWHALYAPAATPRAIIDKLNAALRETVQDPAVLKAYAERGIEAFPPEQMSPEAAAAFTRSEVQRWGKVVRDNHIQAVPQ